MKAEQVKNTLAYNLRFLRKERELSQAAIAEAAGLSFRLIQDLEAGNGNPTIDSISCLARAFRVTATRLLTLSHIRIPETDSGFLVNFKKEFQAASISVGLRNLDGVVHWSNESTLRLLGASQLGGGGEFSILELFTEESRGILKMQLNAEKRGMVNPYTLFFINPLNHERLYLRCHPTLILPKTGRAPLYTSVYITEFDRECEENYYEYCQALFNCIGEA